MLGENGIIKRAENSGITYSEAQAREKLELVLLDMQADKVTNSEYNENEYLTRKIRENKMEVDEDIVSVDGWKFKIDRTIPQIIENLGKGEIQIPYKKENLLVYLDGSDAPINNIWKDRSGNNNDAVMSGAYTHDAKNKAYHFIGEAGQGKIAKFEYKEGVTISACIELLTYDPQNYLFIGNGYAGAPPSRPTLAFSTNAIQMYGGNNSGSSIAYSTLANREYTITMTIDKSGNGKGYINGKLISTANLATTFPATPENDFRIRGYGTTSNTEVNGNLLPTNIHNVLVYDRELSRR